MIKIGLIGAGKMGISHLSILGAHPDVEIVGVCDTSKLTLDVLNKFSLLPGYLNYEQMVEEAMPEAVFVAVPTKYHFAIVKYLLLNNIHVFTEKPFCLTVEEGEELVELATDRNLINQVGYHNKFVGTFQEVKRIVDSGYLGDIYHFMGEAYGPVVLKKKQNNWRADPGEGGGCLMDYASHVIDLINYILNPVHKVKGAILKSIYSRSVDDAVFSLLELSSGVSGILSVNWSDCTFRKMSTSITVMGSQGKIICDASELKVYYNTNSCPKGYEKGWNIRYITSLVQPVEFYLRGEEYTLQLNHFLKAIQREVPNEINNFKSALLTDKAIALIRHINKHQLV